MVRYGSMVGKTLLLKFLIIYFKLIDAVIFVQVNMVQGWVCHLLFVPSNTSTGYRGITEQMAKAVFRLEKHLL